MSTEKQKKARSKRMNEKTLSLRNEIWPELDESALWNRKSAKGFTTIPRALPQIFIIMDFLAGKGHPVSKTYFSLWCYVFDSSMVEIKDYRKAAYEAGFNGPRAVTLWKDRMKRLVDLEFILAHESIDDYDYVLILNPYKVIKKHHEKKKVNRSHYIELVSRANDIGAKDLGD